MRRKLVFWIMPLMLLVPLLAEARITELVITSVESPTFEGLSFGRVGQYERLVGYVRGQLDPVNPLNAGIINIDKAPRNFKGHVEYEAEIFILKPVDLSKGNRRIFYDIPNRSTKLGLYQFNDTPIESINDPRLAADAGNGFLMRKGYTIIWSGWQMSYPISGETSQAFPATGSAGIFARFPTATENGKPIVALSREEFIDDSTEDWFIGNLSYPAANIDPGPATLTVRENQADPRRPLPHAWSYINPLQIKITRPGPPFDAGAIYEFIYPAKDPVIYGIAFASVRDVLSFFRYEVSDDGGNPNPLAPRGIPGIEKVLVFGASQSGRFLRNLIYEGFTQDEKKRQVMDGAMPNISGSRLNWCNFQFALPGVWSRQHATHFQAGDQFPFTYGVLHDPISDREDGILKKCQGTGTCPKIMHTDTDTEIWEARASLVVTDTKGNDIILPENVRVYLFASAQHVPAFSTGPEYCQQLGNPLDYRPLNRALLVALDEWVTDGTEPPASRFPKRADGTLVPSDQSSIGFPHIPGVNYNGRFNWLRLTDYNVQPPSEGDDYPVFVSQVDSDGNGAAGIRVPDVEVPVATYTGWNLRALGHAKGELCDGYGAHLPFARTKAERLATGDPRLSIEERYGDHSVYVNKIAHATNGLVGKRLLLEEDAEDIKKGALGTISP